MSPALRFYPTQQTPIAEVDYWVGLREDLYVNLGSFDPQGAWVTVKAQVTPLVSWLWLGGGLMVLLGTGMFYAVALSLSEQKSDRYLLYAHLAADLAAGGALLWLASLLERSLRLPRRFGTLLLTGAAAVLLLNDLVQLHPRYIAHWNELVPVPENAKFGWGEGLEEAAAYLHETDVPRERLRISSYYPGALRHFLPGVHVERFTSYTDPSYQFAVLYRSMYGREEASPESAAVRDFLGSQPAEGSLVTVDDARFRLEKRILVNRIPFVWIFRRL
jgi:hypothetical protein